MSRPSIRSFGQSGAAMPARAGASPLRVVSPQSPPQRKSQIDTAPATAGRLPAAPRAPRTLAGATILQIVPAMRNEPPARAVLDTALTLLQAGARAIVAGEAGP